MDIITIDFETYYDRDFSLTKLTTEEYIRSDRFEVIGISVKVNNNGTEWASGTHEQIRQWLQSEFNWADALVLAHNTLLTGLSCIGVSVLTLGVGLILCVWAVPFTVWKLAVRLKLWQSGTSSERKVQRYSTPSERDD